MAKNQNRIDKTLQKYAHLLGEGLTDANGTVYDFKKQHEAKTKQHLFLLTNRDEEDTLPTLLLGHVVADKIRDDMYDVDYLGFHRDANAVRKKNAEGVLEFVDDDELTKPHIEMKKKLQKAFKKIDEAIEAAQIRHDEREGLFA